MQKGGFAHAPAAKDRPAGRQRAVPRENGIRNAQRRRRFNPAAACGRDRVAKRCPAVFPVLHGESHDGDVRSAERWRRERTAKTQYLTRSAPIEHDLVARGRSRPA